MNNINGFVEFWETCSEKTRSEFAGYKLFVPNETIDKSIILN